MKPEVAVLPLAEYVITVSLPKLHDQRLCTEPVDMVLRKLAQNIQLVGTSVNVSANALKISFADLLQLMRHYHAHSQALMQAPAHKPIGATHQEPDHG